jgi:hypothetical protein
MPLAMVSTRVFHYLSASSSLTPLTRHDLEDGHSKTKGEEAAGSASTTLSHRKLEHQCVKQTSRMSCQPLNLELATCSGRRRPCDANFFF